MICHNDWGPTNTVFHEGHPYGIIDFDTAAPGLRLWDIGYSAWVWLDLGNPDYTGDEQRRRLAIFCGGYGSAFCPANEIVAYVLARQTALAASATTRVQTDMATWAAKAAEWTVSIMSLNQVP